MIRQRGVRNAGTVNAALGAVLSGRAGRYGRAGMVAWWPGYCPRLGGKHKVHCFEGCRQQTCKSIMRRCYCTAGAQLLFRLGPRWEQTENVAVVQYLLQIQKRKWRVSCVVPEVRTTCDGGEYASADGNSGFHDEGVAGHSWWQICYHRQRDSEDVSIRAKIRGCFVS